MIKIESGNYGIIYYDSDTKVEYVYTYEGGYEVLVDQEGKPVLYKEDE